MIIIFVIIIMIIVIVVIIIIIVITIIIILLSLLLSTSLIIIIIIVIITNNIMYCGFNGLSVIWLSHDFFPFYLCYTQLYYPTLYNFYFYESIHDALVFSSLFFFLLKIKFSYAYSDNFLVKSELTVSSVICL